MNVHKLFIGQDLFRRAVIVSSIQARSVCLTFSKMDEAMQHLQSNPFYGKYANKIDKIRDKHPDAFVKVVKDRKSLASSEAESPAAAAAGVRRVTSVPSSKGKTTLPAGSYNVVPPKKLASVMKTELIEDKSADEVQFLWTKHWQTQSVISGVMPAQLYERIFATAVKYDKFIFPLPREQGYEFFLAQFSGQEIHFASLINYQTFQEDAPECLTIVHYTDIKDRLGIVLMKGEWDSKLLSNKEAQFLANQIQLYYSGTDPVKSKLLADFHEKPNNFSHYDLVQQLEQLDFSVLTNKAAGK